MTIREYCALRMRLARRVGITVGVAALLSLSAYQTWGAVKFNTWFGVAAIVLLIFAVMLPIMWLTRCPRCDHSLSKVVGGSETEGLPYIDACPYCGVSLDQPMQP